MPDRYSQYYQQNDCVQRVLHGIGKGKGGHTDGTPERQGHSEVPKDAYHTYCHRYNRVFACIECRYQELVYCHKGELVGVVLQGNCWQGSILRRILEDLDNQLNETAAYERQ